MTTRSRTGSYRAVARGSFVDEALFGSGSIKDTQPHEQPHKRASPTRKAASPAPAELVVLTTGDLHRMLAPPAIVDAAARIAARREAEAARTEHLAATQARKERILQAEEAARRAAPLSEADAARLEEANATLAAARRKLEEQKDEVKAMNQMVAYAKCMAIRDRQIKEKVDAMVADEAEQRRLDMEAEVERLRALEAYQNRDVRRRQEQARGAAILREQLAERERQRVEAEELRDLERLQMLREAERLRREEDEAAVARRHRAVALMEEVAASNAELIARKEADRAREAAEEAAVAEYIRTRDAREQAVAAERARVTREKEFETARLRAQQERLADRQGEVDELRARRYQDAKDKEVRAKEAAAAARAAAMQHDLQVARETQMRAKLKLQADIAALEEEEFRRVLAVTRSRQDEEDTMADMQRRIHDAHRRDLLAQVAGLEERRRLERAQALEEGARLRQVAAAEKAALEAVKARKLAELAAAGVPAKYCADLQKLQPAAPRKFALK